jgi:hypothetical protein
MDIAKYTAMENSQPHGNMGNAPIYTAIKHFKAVPSDILA